MNTHDVLKALVERVSCKPGWTFRLDKVVNVDHKVFVIRVYDAPDSRRTGHTVTIDHHFPVPEATYNEKTWRRWIFECCRKVEDHELGEWFIDGAERPFAPLHGPGEDPYTVHEFREVVAAHTNQRGDVER